MPLLWHPVTGIFSDSFMSIKRQSLWNMLPQLVAAAAGIISLPLYLRYLGYEMNAVWLYVTVLNGMFGFADMGLGISVGRYLGEALGNKDREALKAYWGTGNIMIVPFLTLMALVFIIIGVWLGPKWFNVSSQNVFLLRECFVAGGVGLFFAYYSQYWNILAQAHLDFKFIGILRVVCALAQIIPTIILAAFTRNPFLLVVWSALIGALQLLAFIWHGRRHYELGFHFESASLARVREMSAYIGKNCFGLIFGSTFGQIDRLILGRFAGHTQFVNYTWAANMGSRLQALSVSVMGPVFFQSARVGSDRNATAAKIYNDTFQFVFDWYLLVAIWVTLWHPVLLRFWLAHSMGAKMGVETAGQVAPLLSPVVIACCIAAISNISAAQLSSINRLGTYIIFNVIGGLLTLDCVLIGWNHGGIVGAAWGFLISRLANVAQDLFAIRLVKAGGWLDIQTWKKAAAQGLVAAAFGSVCLFFQKSSYWLLIPAALHGGLMAVWILRRPLFKFFDASGMLPHFFSRLIASNRPL
ncbi:MAG: oligosaccharide flippase family protein [Limisphaerales bacterium]